MKTNKKVKSIFKEATLKELPLTYRVMNIEDTKNVGELYLSRKFSQSEKHYSGQYMVYVSQKPISNFLIEDE